MRTCCGRRFALVQRKKDVDGRVKPGHDETALPDDAGVRTIAARGELLQAFAGKRVACGPLCYN
jgi:hypothetical protein